MATFSAKEQRSTFSTCRSQLLPKMVATGASVASSSCMKASSSTRAPGRRVLPKAAIRACSRSLRAAG